MDPKSKTLYEWRLHIAIAEAESDTREAPWYGAWDIVLRDFLFLSFCTPPYLTITYPQFPVSKHVDTNNADDYDCDSDSEQGPQSPNIPSRSTAPSPESFRGSRSQLPPTPPRGFPHSPLLKKRTTRIPDFIQLLYEIITNSNGTVPIPIVYTSRIVLVVEIKITLLPTATQFADILHKPITKRAMPFTHPPRPTRLAPFLLLVLCGHM